MKPYPIPLDLKRVKVYPLAERASLSSLEQMIVDPKAAARPVGPEIHQAIQDCGRKVQAARRQGASVILMYGAHLIKNGALRLVNLLIEQGWLTHLATNGAGTIHDWELAFQGMTEESVKDNVATGTFGTWDETGRYAHLALLAGSLEEDGYGRCLGRMIAENGVTLPAPELLEFSLRTETSHPLSAARAELVWAMRSQKLPAGRIEIVHPWREHSVLATAFRSGVPLTVHPGI